MSFLNSLFNTLVSANDTHTTAMKKAGISLAIFAFISVFFVAITDKLTANKIAENQATMLLKALNEVAPEGTYDNELITSKVVLNSAKTGFIGETSVFLATQAGQPAIAIFEVTTNKGYSGAITLLVGINAINKQITGVRVVKHKETPGLGDKMEIQKTPPNKTPWVLVFNGKSLSNPDLKKWDVKKDGGSFDQFTGATITPRAIVNAVKSTLLYAQDNIDAIFDTINTNSITETSNNKEIN